MKQDMELLPQTKKHMTVIEVDKAEFERAAQDGGDGEMVRPATGGGAVPPHQRHEKGTGHLLGAKCLNSWMGDFNSWRSMQQVGMA
jgi:hypothetical protein